MIDPTLLLISDDSGLIGAVSGIVQEVGNLKLTVIPDIEGASSISSWDRIVLVLHHRRPSGRTLEVARLIRMIAATRQPIATLVLGGRGESDQVLDLLRLGVADCLTWPDDQDRLAYLIDVLTVRARPPVDPGPTPADPSFDDGREADRMMEQVRLVAPQETTILLSGETGTGKSRLARLIHDLSTRQSEPFLVVSCGSIAADQIESEMFGHVRGYAGSDRDRIGKFAEVGRGTLFLDEIDALPPSVQGRLLRVVEDRVFEAIGSGQSQPVRARLIASSRRPLDEEVAADRFRSDLYYRLNVVSFHLAPLRERRGSIASLASDFIAEFARKGRRDVNAIGEEALRVMVEHDWPGNIRELRNAIDRAVTLCPGRQIRLEDLPPTLVQQLPASGRKSKVPATQAPASGRATLAETKKDAELARITEALEKHSNNRLRAASELGISRMTLYKKLYKYGLMQHDDARRRGMA